MIIVNFLSNVDWSERREDSFENAKNAFSPAVLFQGRLFNVLWEQRDS